MENMVADGIVEPAINARFIASSGSCVEVGLQGTWGSWASRPGATGLEVDAHAQPREWPKSPAEANVPTGSCRRRLSRRDRASRRKALAAPATSWSSRWRRDCHAMFFDTLFRRGPRKKNRKKKASFM